jgi:oligopeptide transport system substrate-binding protein
VQIEPMTLDPAMIQDTYTSELWSDVYEGLIGYDEKNAIRPLLAESWVISPDQKAYTFHLRNGVKFHNGREFVARDVKYTLERALAPETRSPTAANYLQGIVGLADVISGKAKDLKGCELVDDHTVRITLDRPRGYFLGELTYPTGWIVCKEAIEKSGKYDSAAAVGTGPFALQEYRSGSRVVLRAHLAYWGGAPVLEGIERPIVLSRQTAHAKYDSGELDATVPSLSDFNADVKDPRYQGQAKSVPTAFTIYLAFQERLQPVFGDVKVRRAIAMAIDRDEISRLAYGGAYPRADGFLPVGVPGHNASIRKLPLDISAARQLLAEAGYPGGKDFPSLTLVYPNNTPELAVVAQRVRGDLQSNLGISIETRERESGSFFNDTGPSERIPFFLTGWVADYPDPQDFLSTLLRTGAPLNHLGYSNPAFDALCDKADAETDMTRRIPLYQQADQICVDDVPLFPLVYGAQPILVKPNVQGWSTNLMNFFLPHYKTSVR